MIRVNFSEAERAYNEGDFVALQNCNDGKYFLKLRTLTRKRHLQELSRRTGIDISNLNLKSAFKKMFDEKISVNILEEHIKEIYCIERNLRKDRENDLINELYKLRAFDWGSLHQNNLEKSIVNNYIKKITSFDELNHKIDGEIFDSLRGYTHCSWYNHWTSIIIEDIFKDHSNVLPSVGFIKQIDFFINDVPFDLKVTYFPEGYIKEKRKQNEKASELSLLKNCARDNNIPFDGRETEKNLVEDLWLKVSDSQNPDCIILINELKEFRNNLVDEAISEPSQLIRWLYENQGTRRFDSANRFFLILINKNNYFDSWKLKRMRDFLKQEINNYLDTIGESPGLNLSFNFDGETFHTKSDTLIITKD